MRRRLSGLSVLAATLVCALPAGPAPAADVYGVRFDPPRLYFTHANINKSGMLSALRGQDNFLNLYMPPVDNAEGRYTPEGFSVSLLLPDYLEVLDQAERGQTVTPIQHEGRPYLRVTWEVDPVQVKARCFVGDWGVYDAGPVWYRVKAGAEVPTEPQPVQVTLLYLDEECFVDSARLRVYEAIEPGPRVSPEHFRLWLHYGPHNRPGHWDELAHYLELAGINGIQVTAGGPGALEYTQEMRERGFYIIAQRSGSYSALYKDNMRACLEQGPAWFEQSDDGTMTTYLPYSDAALWDYEPSPLPTGLDDWLIAEFRQDQGLPADELLTEETIRAKYLREYIEFRQTQLATCIKHWADYCRSVNPDIETILTEGGVLTFDPPGQVDYGKYQDYVTFCDPMNFTGMQALLVVRQWQVAAPRAGFTGCQNVALSSYHNVFIPARTIMMQTLSAALIGLQGTSVYPGPTMDAENFVAWARVTEFMGRHEELIFTGRRDPTQVGLELLPKEEQTVTLGDGRELRNRYPDWEREAIVRSYAATDDSEFVTVIANWHAKEPAYGKLTLDLPGGTWLLADDENRLLFTRGGKPKLNAGRLKEGVFVHCPPFDYRGLRVTRATPAALAAVKEYESTDLAPVELAAMAYAEPTGGSGATAGAGDQELGFDDVDGDGTFEYLVQSEEQKVWVTQNGTILRWQVGDQTLEGGELGLGRDMLWLPLGERENRGMDMVMRLEDKEIRDDGISLTFSKDVPLATVGGGASFRVVKELDFADSPGEVSVRVRIANTSVAPEATKLTGSYRVHHYVKHDAAASILWTNDGAAVRQWDSVETHYSIPNTGLSDTDADSVFTQCEVTEPLRPVSFGDYLPSRELLLKFTPSKPEELLQLLRWGRKPGVAGSSTVEWMYRPAILAVGEDLVYEYRINLQPNVADLDTQSTQPHSGARAAAGEPQLLFHLGFEGTTDPTIAAGESQVEVTGTPTYEDTPGGQGIRLTEGVELSYLPAGNIDLERGRVAMRFKPTWEGADDQTHYLLTVRPKTGFVYLGKLADGRLLMNMFDAADEQHYPQHMIRTVPAGTWHEVVVTWDTSRGLMLMFLDDQKVAEYRVEPWQMAELDNGLAHCRLILPGQAEAIIDDLKIWDQP